MSPVMPVLEEERVRHRGILAADAPGVVDLELVVELRQLELEQHSSSERELVAVGVGNVGPRCMVRGRPRRLVIERREGNRIPRVGPREREEAVADAKVRVERRAGVHVGLAVPVRRRPQDAPHLGVDVHGAEPAVGKDGWPEGPEGVGDSELPMGICTSPKSPSVLLGVGLMNSPPPARGSPMPLKANERPWTLTSGMVARAIQFNPADCSRWRMVESPTNVCVAAPSSVFPSGLKAVLSL